MANNVIGTGFITMLHFTRNAFFFLSGLVVCYAQITRPRSLWGFWIRRYVQIGVPYLAWTRHLRRSSPFCGRAARGTRRGPYFWTDIRIGYYQLYVDRRALPVLSGLPVPPEAAAVDVRTRPRGDHVDQRRHRAASSASTSTSIRTSARVGHAIHDIGNGWVWSRNLVSYQVYFVVGVMVAFHFDAVLAVRATMASPDPVASAPRSA